MKNEKWLPIPGFGGHYEASSVGRIRVKDRDITRKHSTGSIVTFHYKGRILSPSIADEYGHTAVHLGVDGRKYTVAVHRLVLLAFSGDCPDGMEACHCNGIAGDNRSTNLRWDTHFSNNQDRKNHGRYAAGENHPMAKLSRAIVAAIRSDSCSGKDAAVKYGTSTANVSRIRRNEMWT